MELIQGKELFEMINELGHYCEEDAKRLFYQLLTAIEYMHKHGICHRDLKPHNILCVESKKAFLFIHTIRPIRIKDHRFQCEQVQRELQGVLRVEPGHRDVDLHRDRGVFGP